MLGTVAKAFAGDPILERSGRVCARVARSAAGNFYYGFMLLPAARKRAMCALYAFLRRTDDLVDEPGSDAEKRERFGRWREDVTSALGGEPAAVSFERAAILPAFVDAVRTYGIPHRYLQDALDGVAMDLRHEPFATFEDLYRYCYGVASTAGLCCLHIWGFDSGGGQAEKMAEACGVAFQLTNIVRDVREDAQRGRVYLPLEDLRKFGVSPETLASGGMDAGVRELLAFECRRAEGYYAESAPLVDRVDAAGRPMLRAMVGIYRGLLDSIRRAGYDVFSRRVALSRWRKAAIALRALAGGRTG